MSKTALSSAGEWDEIRVDDSLAAVREAVIRKAYLRPEMTVADIGAGAGYLAAGLAPRVRKVSVLRDSPAMLEVVRKNLTEFGNLVFQQTDGVSLPLPDASMDAVFANMYLHHAPDPLAAIREMVRVLRPGGRLVIMDTDALDYARLEEEMADVRQDFDRDQMRAWLEQSEDLVNVIIDPIGQSYQVEKETAVITSPSGRKAETRIFVAVGTRRVSGAREVVQANYGVAALNNTGCCTPGTSGSSLLDLINMDSLDVQFNPLYTETEQLSVPKEAADLTLGCGNPTATAALQPGEVVLDIGSGAGMDAFLAAKQVGPTGKVIGVDMTPQMLERARRGAVRAGLQQVEFRLGQAEALPVEDASIDVIISNCVINLTEDKGLVFREAYRALKPGGRLEVSDMVADNAFPPEVRANPSDWPGCIFGALPEQEYLDLVAQAGFRDLRTRRSLSYGQGMDVQVYSMAVSAKK